MISYTYLYKEQMNIASEWNARWDLFISGYNKNIRIQRVYSKVLAERKLWLIHKEYGFDSVEEVSGEKFYSDTDDEGEYILDLFDQIFSNESIKSWAICIDITGIMRPHMMFLIRLLASRGVSQVDILYSEPTYYSNKEETRFSENSSTAVRQVTGFEGVIDNDTSKDLLIIGAGYETHLIADIAEEKDKARKAVLLGLPSLSADMYQQNSWRVGLAGDALGESIVGKYFAPANDPFVTATVLSEIYAIQQRTYGVTNLYLAPLATKAQALGFTLFYISECEGRPASIIFPFSSRYSRETSEGISRVWRYRLEFPLQSAY